MIEISAVIATYNREAYLIKALQSLLIQTIDRNQFEVIIVDNNCTDNTAQVCKEFHANNPHIKYKYVVEEQQGLSYGRNRGINEATGKYLTFVDDDAYLDSEFLLKSVEYLKNNESVYAIGGKILLDYEVKIPKWVSPYLEPLFGYFNFGDSPRYFKKPKFPRGSNMTFKTAVFSKVGMFNPKLGRKKRELGSGEEKELFDRIYSANLGVYYLPEIIVYHYVPEARTRIEFIKKQAINTGISENIRVRNSLQKSFTRILQEIWKWMASILLLIYFALRLKASKGVMVLKFRYWVTVGFLKGG